ncbi:MAG: thiamine phosphate synthase [Chitinophagaceae bacterium]|nr:thiamine phosphate synthase [Chitinophagaceae bacterium]
MTGAHFLLAVITSPVAAPGEADYLEGLLEEGLEKLHIRKPGDTEDAREALLERLAPRWCSRLVLHGGRDVVELARRYKIPQIHGHWHKPWLEDGGLPGSQKIVVSASLHSWEEVREVPSGVLEYIFLSPLFDSISKPGYPAGDGLLQRPAGVAPCRLIGLGGIGADTIGEVIKHGWDGAALLGYIWQQPERAVERFRILKEIISHYGR